MDSINELIKKRKKLRKKFVFQVEMNHIKATVIEMQYKMSNFRTKICQNFDTILKSKKSLNQISYMIICCLKTIFLFTLMRFTHIVRFIKIPKRQNMQIVQLERQRSWQQNKCQFRFVYSPLVYQFTCITCDDTTQLV